ncbi:class I SAM-dependent methyltransferase [Aquimarina sediminis]|uniref:class I SAM-dependent methyltransferase n=1 Tax=Aquimarina sediminis TaxID=2070536 RepID=UPI000CA067EE|nr:class I SAM-dependent methyltransferase [Aquimarina sediminis]
MQEKYDTIGVNYNLTRKADPYLFSRLQSLLSPSLEETYLDIGCGTGNYTTIFSEKGYQFIGIDPSSEMLEKAASRNNSISWKIGKAENIELPKESVHGIIASLTIHHWSDIFKGFSELNRVLIPNGKIVIFTATPNQMKGYWLNHYFPKMMADSIAQMPPYHQIESTLKANNLYIKTTEKYNILPDLQDLFLYSGKNNPSLYLKPTVRHGISSFSSLANIKEVNQGLATLEKDIVSGKIKDIISTYKNTKGDYLFIVVEKV